MKQMAQFYSNQVGFQHNVTRYKHKSNLLPIFTICIQFCFIRIILVIKYCDNVLQKDFI
jgi:hypothetical protein